MYGVDGNQDGLKDPYNPVDAIFAAARYLKAAGAEHRPARRDLRVQPRRLVRRLGHPARALHRRPAGRPRRLAVRAHAGPLPGPGEGVLRQGGPPDRSGEASPSYVVESSDRRNGITIFAKRGRARRRRQRRADRRHRPQPPARQLRDAAGRLRQHVHVRAPEVGRRDLPDAQAAHGRRQGASGASSRSRRATPRPTGPRPRRPGRRRSRRKAPRRASRDQKPGAAPRRRARPRRKERLFANPDRPNAAAAGGDAAGATELSRGLRRLPQPRLRPRPLRRRHEAARARRARHRRHRARAHRRGVRAHGAAPAVRDPARPAAAPRGSIPSRSSTAGSCSSRPRSTAPPTATRSSARTRRPRRSARSC